MQSAAAPDSFGTDDIMGHSLLAAPHTGRHNFYAASIAALHRAAGFTAAYERDAGGGGRNHPAGDPSKRIEVRLYATAPQGGDTWLDVTFKSTSTPAALAAAHTGVHGSRALLEAAERHKRELYTPALRAGSGDEVKGLAISTHGRCGPGHRAQLEKALSRFPSKPENCPLSWSAQTKRTQWLQTLSVAFWRGTAIEYENQLDLWRQRLDKTDRGACRNRKRRSGGA